MRIILFLLVVLAFSCKNKHKGLSIVKSTIISPKRDSTLLNIKLQTKELSTQNGLDTLAIKNVKFNDKPMLFLLKDLNVRNVDSIKYNLWECGNPFEWMDKRYSVDSLRHIYVQKLEYITNENKILLYSANFENNEFVASDRNIILNSKTTLNDFKMLFPNSYRQYIKEKLSNPENYKREDYIIVSFNTKQSDDYWIFSFNKKGILIKFELYWLLC